MIGIFGEAARFQRRLKCKIFCYSSPVCNTTLLHSALLLVFAMHEDVRDFTQFWYYVVNLSDLSYRPICNYFCIQTKQDSIPQIKLELVLSVVY